MKKEKSSKFKYIVVWMRGDIISKLRFGEWRPAMSFAQELNVLAHVYKLDTFEIVGVNKYSRMKFNVAR